MLKTLIDQLSKELWEGERVSPNDEGTFILRFKGDLVISLKEEEGVGVTFVCPIAPLPSKHQESYLERTMEANLLGRETGGSVLGLAADGKHILMTQRLPIDVNYREFHDALEDFINYAESWRHETAEFVEKK